MQIMNKNIAIILASGIGARFGSTTPKQFMKLAGKSVLEHTLDCFESHGQIDEILIVTALDQKPLVKDIILKAAYKKVSRILIGGATRQESSEVGIVAIAGDKHKVLVHDAVRPLLDHATINRCLSALDNHDCIDTVIPSSDTIVRADSNDCIAEIPDRSQLRLGQTPQGFRSGLLRQAHKLAKGKTDIKVTDDCGLVLHFGLAPVKLVDGNVSNIKITYPSDIYLADRLFQLRKTQLEALNLQQLKNKVLVVFGSSRGIGKAVAELAMQHQAHVVEASRNTGVDICDRTAVRNVFKDALQQYGKVDYVVNTAGVLRTGALMNQNDELLDEMLHTNLKGALIIAQEAFSVMQQQGGSIALFTSSSYTRGRAFSTVYSATKAAIVNLVQGLSDEFFSVNVRINAINPERTATPMRTENFGNEPAELLLTADKVAQYTLASLIAGITGEVVDVRR